MCSAYRKLLSFASTLAIAAFGILCLSARAEQLPIKIHTPADGLLRDSVYRIN